MANATLIISQPGMETREMTVAAGAAISIGRALDNTVCFDGDPNISRYHAVIDARADGFWLSDLGSSNGTTVNDRPIPYEYKLQDGDLIILGGSSTIEFRAQAAGGGTAPPPVQPATTPPDISAAAPAAAPTATITTPVAAAPAASSSSSIILLCAIGGGFVLLLAGVILYFGGFIGGGCQPTARIVSPQSGTTVRGSVRVRVETEDTKCIERIIYHLDGNEVARAEASPYGITLNVSELVGVGDGNHLLTVTVEDDEGRKKLQPDEILLAFASAGGSSTTTPTPSAQETPAPNATPLPTSPPPGPTGPVDIAGLSRGFAGQVSRKSGYIIDPEFAQLIAARTNEYRLGGYTDRARRYRRDINKAFRDKGLEPVVGYVMAMSRSKLNEGATGEGIGLWQVPPAVVQAQGYLPATEPAATALADPKRSSDVAATYMKDLINVFEMDDFMYAVACFGMPISQAGELRTKLITVAPDPAARRDFWKMVKLGVVGRDQADRVARFFAAGIVGENPQQFGLTNEQSFSSLY